MSSTTRLLTDADTSTLEAFLFERRATTMFLRGNLADVGTLEAPGGPQYAARFERGGITAVVSHSLHGPVLAAGDVDEAVVAAVLRRSGRPVRGFVGEWDAAQRAWAVSGMAGQPTSLLSRERLYTLALDRLVTPAPLLAGELAARRAVPSDREQLTAWLVAYEVEALGRPDDAETLAEAERSVDAALERRRQFVLEADGQIVSTARFNAQVGSDVQIGAVWTPREWRRRGYARAVVAGALEIGRAEGATFSVLFTSEDNLPAQRAYLPLGYEHVGHFGLILFVEPGLAPLVS